MRFSEFMEYEACMVGDDPPGLAELVDRPAWMRDAACLEHPEVSFFVDRGGDIGAAKAVCHGCLARGDCLTYAVEHGERHGIWGGTSARERRHLRDHPQAA